MANTRLISARDLADLRSWLTQYENSGCARTRRARVYQTYDAYDGATQFGKGKRTGLWGGSGRSSFTYDKAGRLTREEWALDGFT